MHTSRHQHSPRGTPLFHAKRLISIGVFSNILPYFSSGSHQTRALS